MGKKKGGGSNIPEWLVTFSDLMSILVAFFVLIVSFSIQDNEKLQVVAGSMREAFGVRKERAKAGLIEVEGTPVRDFVKKLEANERPEDSDFDTIENVNRKRQGPKANTHDIERADVSKPNHFALAAVSLRQAWQAMPEITFVADNLLVEQTEQGLHIQIIDQEGRPMFAEGSKYPLESTRNAISVMAPILSQLPNQIKITGHTAAGGFYPDSFYGPWELTSDRANVVRSILNEHGLSQDRFHSVVGKADTDPLFANDPFLASNMRVSILVMNEDPPVPPSLRP